MREYIGVLRRVFGPNRAANAPPPEIEVTATPEELKRMFERTRSAWTRLGESRPHFSVLTEERFRPERLVTSADEFWESGQVEAAMIAELLEGIGCVSGDDKICVEYGCGIGRVTIPLAARYGAVHAYDISASHLDLARRRARELGAENIRFEQCADLERLRIAPCDFFYSRLVLQHNPPPVIRFLVRAALRSLRPGGVATFGVPEYLPGYRFRVAEYLAQPPRARAEMHCLPKEEVLGVVRAEGCDVVEVREERAGERGHETLSNIFVIRRPPNS